VKTGCNPADSSKEGYGPKLGCFSDYDEILTAVKIDQK
jgi:hypothetical protein